MHMNNIAAAITAYSGLTLAVFATLGSVLGTDGAPVLVSCFVSSALIAHMFAGSVTSTYVGIPAEDVLSVLPAHRLAKAGLGHAAVLASAQGCLAGVLLGTLLMFPICAVMGPPVGFYDVLRQVMLLIVLIASGVLLLSEGSRSLRPRARRQDFVLRVLKASAVLGSAGMLGLIVFRSDFYACPIPDVPWLAQGFVPRSSLLLPMFAGLFGIPGLLLSLGSRTVLDVHFSPGLRSGHRPSLSELVLSIIGGVIVGWLPGMTSGSAVALCSPGTDELSSKDDVKGSLRFIWLYSSISSAGAVFAVGALFVIFRARSGSMDAVAYFLSEGSSSAPLASQLLPMTSMLLAMVLSAVVSYRVLAASEAWLRRTRRLLCSKGLSIASLVFVASLSIALTGTRGVLLMVASSTLGMIPPLAGVRRIQLMGCLLVPIAVLLFELR